MKHMITNISGKSQRKQYPTPVTNTIVCHFLRIDMNTKVMKICQDSRIFNANAR